MRIFITGRDDKTGEILGLQRWDKSGKLEEADTNDSEIVEFYENRKSIETAEKDRLIEINAKREEVGLRKVTITQAEKFIDDQLDGATTIAQLREATRAVLKRMMPFILE